MRTWWFELSIKVRGNITKNVITRCNDRFLGGKGRIWQATSPPWHQPKLAVVYSTYSYRPCFQNYGTAFPPFS